MLNNLKEINVVGLGENDYPSLLLEIPNPPKKIFYIGELPYIEEKCIAIVGTRKATTEGKKLAEKTAQELSQAGFSIISGLAMGIDTASHEGCIKAGGKTYAVLACGLPEIYPAQNINLAKKIIDYKGGIISEYPTGTPTLPYQFLERNRIVSGLCVATIVIEAPEKSGAIATARFAGEQGREVFVFPGPANHPNYRGSHALIRDGCRLVENTSQILEDLGIVPEKSKQNEFNFSTKTELEKNIINSLEQSRNGLSVDKLSEIHNLEAKDIQKTLTMLLMSGDIKEERGKYTL